MNKKIIFDLTRDDYSYKGVLFAEVDFNAIDKEIEKDLGILLAPKHFVVGIMAIIWTDEKGIWHTKMRIKFPSGNKFVMSASFEDEFNEKVNVNETYVLNRLYNMPMINKTWTKNPDGTPDGIVKIMKDLDMIESMWFEKIE